MAVADLLFGFVLYLVPTAGLPLMLQRGENLNRISLVVFATAPLIGEITYLILSRHHTISVLSNPDFWKTVFSYYPMALFPLGLWADLLAAASVGVLQAQRQTYRATFLFIGGAAIGGFVGFIFMSVYTLLSASILRPPKDGIAPYLVAGLVAGFFPVLCALISSS